MERFECLFCRKQYALDVFDPFCPRCSEPMVVSIAPRKRNFALEKSLTLEKFLSFLPLGRIDKRLSLDEGNTPLVPLYRIMKKHGLPLVLAKNEAVNPTQSFKDRGTAVAVQKADSLGIKRIGTVSTGNMACSTAAYGAKAGLETFVLLKEGTPAEKVLSTGIHGARLFKVKGDYGKLFYQSYEIGRRNKVYFINSVDPFRIEGYKVTSYETYLQLHKRAPRLVFVPVSSGGHLIGLMRGFQDLRQEEQIFEMPKFVGVQARGCSPLSRAFEQGKIRFKRFLRGRTIAHAISNPAPPAGNAVLKLIREHDGHLMDVTDREILAARRELAELEGIFADPASATTLAALLRLAKEKRIRLRAEIVLVITGSGLKSLETLQSRAISVQQTSLERLAENLEACLG